MKNKSYTILGLLQVFTGMGALAGGIPMVFHPDGMAQGMSISILANSPFPDFFMPGLFLLIVIGAGHLFGAFLSLYQKRYAGWAGIALGIVLTIWIAVQVYFIGLSSWLQLVFLLVGMAELVLGILIIRELRKDFQSKH